MYVCLVAVSAFVSSSLSASVSVSTHVSGISGARTCYDKQPHTHRRVQLFFAMVIKQLPVLS